MKLLLTALAGLALVACSSDPAEQPDEPVNTETPADSGAAKAQTVALKITGMT